jgi:hypothetical protein
MSFLLGITSWNISQLGEEEQQQCTNFSFGPTFGRMFIRCLFWCYYQISYGNNNNVRANFSFGPTIF